MVKDQMTLTVEQREFYDFLKLFVKTHGVGPTWREMGAGLVAGEAIVRRRHPGQISRTLGCLEERGWLERLPGRSRAIKFHH